MSQAENALPDAAYDYCPIIGNTVAAPAGNVQAPTGTVAMAIRAIHGPCIGPQCRFWNDDTSECKIVEIPDALERLITAIGIAAKRGQ